MDKLSSNEILRKAMDKALKNGFMPTEIKSIPTSDWYLSKYIILKQYYILIFSHDFAKAFWGEEEVCPYRNNCPGCEVCKTDGYKIKAWEAHLQVMVLEENPLKYLEKFL